MTQDEQKTAELLKRPVTRACVKELKDHGDGLDDGAIAFVENFMRDGLWSKMEGLDDDPIAQKIFHGTCHNQ